MNIEDTGIYELIGEKGIVTVLQDIAWYASTEAPRGSNSIENTWKDIEKTISDLAKRVKWLREDYTTHNERNEP